MNMSVFMGRLARNPEIRMVQMQDKGMKVATFPLVVKRNHSNKTFVIRVTAYGKNADFAQNYFVQGSKIMVNGEIVINPVKDQNTGKTLYFTELLMDQIEFGESKAAMEERQKQSEEFTPAPDGTPFDIPPEYDAEVPFQ